jgi:hypothetical protein
LLDTEIDPLIEIHERVVSPELVLDVRAAYDLVGFADQQGEYFQRLGLQLYQSALPAQFTIPQVERIGMKPYELRVRYFGNHGNLPLRFGPRESLIYRLLLMEGCRLGELKEKKGILAEFFMSK